MSEIIYYHQRHRVVFLTPLSDGDGDNDGDGDGSVLKQPVDVCKVYNSVQPIDVYTDSLTDWTDVSCVLHTGGQF